MPSGINPLLRQICDLPTAPFCEDAVMAWCREVAKQYKLDLRHDRFGNLLLQARGGSPRWVFVAHMDHPGMVALDQPRTGIVRAAFRGGVLASHLRRVPVVFFDATRKVTGRITSAKAGERGMAVEVTVRVEEPVPAGACGMFDLPVTRQDGRLVYSRAIDDVGGVAAIVQAVIDCRKKRSGPGVAALLTRGEEDGFIGAIAAAKDGRLLKKSDLIISVECSAMQPYAPQGKGVVIRVGDKTSIFDSAMTYQIGQIAERLAKTRKGFAFQRALMPGGTCEATPFNVYGYRSAALCIPLGNYHNMVPEKRQIAAEYIDRNDWQALVDLLTAIGRTRPVDGVRLLQGKLDKRFAKRGKLLTQ